MNLKKCPSTTHCLNLCDFTEACWIKCIEKEGDVIKKFLAQDKYVCP